MIVESRKINNELPYVWPSNNKEIIFDELAQEGFNHIHLLGKAGSGKSRCLFELKKIIQKDPSKIVIDYSCSDKRDANTSTLEIINGFTFEEKKINSYKGASDLIEQHSKLKNLIIIIDDFHYKSDAINRFVENFVYKYSNTADLNVTLITASRDPFSLKKSHNFRLIELDNLSSDETKSLIDKGCLENKTIKMLRKNLLKGSKGNPLYISEAVNIITQATKDPLLKLDPTVFFNINGIDDLYDMVLSSLDETQQLILKVASVIGKRFSCKDVLFILPECKKVIKQNIISLCEKNILVRYDNTDEYGFTHDKQLENTYKNVALNERWAWHLTQAKKYKNLRRYDLCGHHYYLSESYEESIKYLTFTARKSLNQGHPIKAEVFFKRALEAFETSYLSHKKSFFKLQMDYCYLLLMQGRYSNAEKIFYKLKASLKKSWVKERDQITSLDIKLKWMGGKYGKEYAVSMLDSLPKSPSFFTDRSRLIGMLSDSGEHQESIKRTNELLKELEKEKIWKDKSFSSTRMACTVMLSIDYAALGDEDNALKHINDNIKKIDLIKCGSEKIYALTFTTEALHRLGKYEEAKPLIEQAYELNLEFKIGIINPHILSRYAHNLAFFGDTLQALELFDEGISFNTSNNYMSGVPYFKILMAKIYGSMCMERVAIDILQNAEKIALDQNNKYYIALIYYELFQISFTRPNIVKGVLEKSSEKYLEECLSIALENNLTPLINKCKNAYNCILQKPFNFL